MVKSCCKNIPGIRKVSLIVEHFEIYFQKRKKTIEKIHVGFKKSSNLFETKNRIPDSLMDNFFLPIYLQLFGTIFGIQNKCS